MQTFALELNSINALILRSACVLLWDMYIAATADTSVKVRKQDIWILNYCVCVCVVAPDHTQVRLPACEAALLSRGFAL